jgi:hypothetical protein
MANDDIERLLDDGACTAGDAPEREMLQPARRRERRKIAAGYRIAGGRLAQRQFGRWRSSSGRESTP